jgi:hypothetical protein
MWKYKSLVEVSYKFEDSKKKFYQILLNFKPRSLSKFSFEIQLEFEEVSMEKFVPLFKPFNSIFYLNFLEHGKSTFRSNQFKPI